MTDFSQRQLVIDWYNGGKSLAPSALQAVKATGLIHKASEGSNFKDSYFAPNITAAREAGGIVLGAYHFMLGDADPVAQAHNFLAQLALVGGPQGLIIAIDVESEAGHPDPTRSQAAAMIAELQAHGVTQTPLVYTGRWYWSGHLKNPDGASLGLLWDSSYVTGQGDPWAILGNLAPGQMSGPGVTPDFFPPYGGWDLAHRSMRQYSSSATVQGRNTDVSVFYGSFADLAALAGAVAPAPAPAPVPAPTPTPTPAPGPAPAPTPEEHYVTGLPTLIKGNTDHAHSIVLQRIIKAVDDGNFGPNTDTAVRNYQRSKGLTPDGVVGPITWGSLLGATVK